MSVSDLIAENNRSSIASYRRKSFCINLHLHKLMISPAMNFYCSLKVSYPTLRFWGSLGISFDLGKTFGSQQSQFWWQDWKSPPSPVLKLLKASSGQQGSWRSFRTWWVGDKADDIIHVPGHKVAIGFQTVLFILLFDPISFTLNFKPLCWSSCYSPSSLHNCMPTHHTVDLVLLGDKSWILLCGI